MYYCIRNLDSRFRGNIGSEIEWMHEGDGYDFTVVILPLPSNDRQTIEGDVKVNGKFLRETEIAKDKKAPVNQSFRI